MVAIDFSGACLSGFCACKCLESVSLPTGGGRRLVSLGLGWIGSGGVKPGLPGEPDKLYRCVRCCGQALKLTAVLGDHPW